MKTIEEVTCLLFIPRSSQRDYITFTSHRDDGCSSHIGRYGGQQFVRIGPGCNYQYIILHELCHALGMWHEQSRPDRDEYVEVIWENIESGKGHNFLKRNKFGIDSQGSGYDYSSIMHYRLNEFSARFGANTLRVINDEEYEKQGRPQLGDAQTLSMSDITQLNRLYNCPESGIPGYLEVYVDHVENLSGFQPYVYIEAYDDQGHWQTLTAINSLTPTAEIANMLKFGDSIDRIKVSWQYISVSVKAYTADGYVFEVINPMSFSVNPGHQYRELCDDFFCTRQVFFSIFLSDSCSCFSGGTCLPDGTCVCSENSGGPYCQYARGRLIIFPRSATNLIHTNDTNGYYHLQFRAYEHTGFLTSVKGAFSTSDST